MDLLEREQWRRAQLAALGADTLAAIPFHQVITADPDGPARLVMDFGRGAADGLFGRLSASYLPRSATVDASAAHLEPLHALGMALEADVPIDHVALNAGLDSRITKATLRWIAGHPGLSAARSVSLRGIPVATESLGVFGGLSGVERLDAGNTKAELSALVKCAWPNLQYVDLSVAKGTGEDAIALLSRMPRLRGAAMPNALFKSFDAFVDSGLSKSWDFLACAPGAKADRLARVLEGDLLGEGLRTLSFSAMVPGAPSSATILKHGVLSGLQTLRFGRLYGTGLDGLVSELPELRALQLSALDEAVLRWLAAQPWLPRLHALDLQIEAMEGVEPVRAVLERLGGDLAALKIRPQRRSELGDSKPSLSELLGEAELPSLRSLDLIGVHVGEADLTILSEIAPRLQALSVLGPEPLKQAHVEVLAGRNEPLRVLQWGVQIEPDAVPALLRSGLAGSLQRLELPEAAMEDATCLLLADTPMPSAVALHLQVHQPTPETLARLHQTQNKPNLATFSGVNLFDRSPGGPAWRMRIGPAAAFVPLRWGSTALLRTPLS
ncbi:MAG: hypothetical protein EP330_11170 [Deltaproteobacteria bacterium]|nr:MAG: hypothetical protein EP330_11170 [Deltaproteobacteria bacterium]